MPRTRSHKKVRELHLVKRLLGANYRISVRKYRARGAGNTDREDMRLAEELAGAIARILKHRGRTKG